MLEFVLISVAILGSLLCGLIDLKTTEIPDAIPISMSITGVTLWFLYSLQINNFEPVLLSLVVGTGFLLFGLLFYVTKQWGGGDVLLLSSIGYLLPKWVFSSNSILPFPFAFIFNVFVVGIVYMILYILILGVVRRKVLYYFYEDLRKGWEWIAIILFVLTGSLLLFNTSPILILSIDFFLLLLVYTKSVERYFIRKISVSKLKEGDVLADGRIEGLTKRQVASLKRKGGSVKIKDGVRYGPVFFLTLFFTLIFGSFIEYVFVWIL